MSDIASILQSVEAVKRYLCAEAGVRYEGGPGFIPPSDEFLRLMDTLIVWSYSNFPTAWQPLQHLRDLETRKHGKETSVLMSGFVQCFRKPPSPDEWLEAVTKADAALNAIKKRVEAEEPDRWLDGLDMQDLSPLHRSLLRYMVGRTAADLADLCRHVWGDECKSTDAVHAALHKVNEFLGKNCCPRTLTKVRGEHTVRWQ